MAGDDFVPPAVTFPEAPTLPKIAREGLVLLAVETELCPFVLPNVLAIVGDRGVTAFTINARRDGRVQRIEIEMAAPRERGTSLMLQDLRRLRNVRQARFGFPPHESGLPIAAKL